MAVFRFLLYYVRNCVEIEDRLNIIIYFTGGSLKGGGRFLQFFVVCGLWRCQTSNFNLTADLVRRLQSVLIAAAQLIYQMRYADHITDALASVQRLRVPEQIEYQVAVAD